MDGPTFVQADCAALGGDRCWSYTFWEAMRGPCGRRPTPGAMDVGGAPARRPGPSR